MELEKQKNEKNRKTRNRILKKAGERYGTYINLYNFEHYYCCRSNLGDYRILSISSGSKMNNILHRLGAKAPRVFRGINGKFFALQMYVLAASDAEGKILDASYLYTSILLKPSREVKADQLIGQYIPTIDVTKLQQDKKVYRAVCNLQEDYRKRCNLNAGRKATAFMSK